MQAALDAAEETRLGMADADLTVRVQGELLTDEFRLHLGGSLVMSMMDMTMDFPLELYVFRSPDALNARVYVMEQWMTGSIPFGSEEPDGASAGIPGFSLSEDALDRAVVREEKETVGDRECYRLDLALRAGDLGLPTGIPAEQVPGWEELTCTATYWVDVETNLPVRLILSAEGSAGTEEFVLRRAEIRIDFTGFGAVEEIPIPGEADDGTGFSL